MNQQPPYGQPQWEHYPPPPPYSSPSQKPTQPHNYRGWVLGALVIGYLLSLALVTMEIVVTGGTSTTRSPTSSSPGILGSVGAIFLIVVSGCIVVLDSKSFFTLFGSIQWRRLKGWQRIGLAFIYLYLWIIPIIYLVLALRYFLSLRDLTLGGALYSGWRGYRAKTTISQIGIGITCLLLVATFLVGTSFAALVDQASTLGLHTPTPTSAATPTPPSGISLRSSSSANNGAGSTSLTISKPSNVQSGDVLVAHVVVQTTGNSIAAPTGWNIIKRQDTSSAIATATYWKVAGSSEPSSYTWNFGTSGEASGGIGSYIGVNTTTPIDVSHPQYNDGTSNVDNSGVTTTVSNGMLVYAVGIIIPTSVQAPSGFMESSYSATNSKTTSQVFQKIASSTGTTGTIHTTITIGKYSNVSQLIALKPASAPTPTPPPGISLRSSSANTTGGSSTSLTLSVPPGTTSGDVMVAHVAVRTAGNIITAPSGWTQIVRKGTNSVLSTVAYYKVAGSSEPSSYTWNFGTSGEASGGIGSYIGVNSTTPVDASNGQYNSTTNNVDNSGVTTTAANDMLVYAVGVVHAISINPPSGFTEQFYTASNSLTTSEMSQEIDSSTGATGTIHGTENGGATYSNVTLLIALKAQ